jgi:hypothetical protein
MKGYVLSGGKCFYVGADCGRVDVGSGACSVCRQGLELVGFSCLLATDKIDNCYLYDRLGCKICKKGFALFQNKCLPIPFCDPR